MNQAISRHVSTHESDSESLKLIQDAFSETMTDNASFHHICEETDSHIEFCKISNNITRHEELHESVLVTLSRINSQTPTPKPTYADKNIIHSYDASINNDDLASDDRRLEALHPERKVLGGLEVFLETKEQKNRAYEFTHEIRGLDTEIKELLT